MRKLISLFISILLLVGCGKQTTDDYIELKLLKIFGDFYVAEDLNCETYYVDYSDGILYVIPPERTVLEKYACDTPKLLASKFDAAQIIKSGQLELPGSNGMALGNLYITSTEIISFEFSELKVIERLPLKKVGITRISNYDDYISKLNMLLEAVSDRLEYKVTFDSNENPVLYKNDRIVYYNGNQVYLKNVTDLYEDAISYSEYYDRFVQILSRVELLRKSNSLYDYSCLIFNDSICFVSDSGYLVTEKLFNESM